MKKVLFSAICVMAVLFSCKNQGQTTSDASNDSVDVEEVDEAIVETNDTTPLPMFLMGCDKKYSQMLYWAELEEPKKDPEYAEYFDAWHSSWALQEMFRRNRANYTNLLVDDDKFVKIKYVDEVLKDPDGNTPSIGERHGREEIPSLCARFDVGKHDGCIIVTDSYLESRKLMPVKFFEYQWGKEKPLPAEVVKQLGEKYGMKVERSVLLCKIGDDYTYGTIQFKGAYKNAPKDKYDPDRQSALALDVLVKGDKVIVNEQLGYYDPDYGATWNADDEGLYVGCDPLAAFEGPNGLEICYMRNAPESSTVGMFFEQEDKLLEREYECYHNMIDEEIPVWKKDFETMRKMYYADEMGDKDVKLTKWSHCYIDYDNEWIWLSDEDESNGAFFTRKDGKFTLIAIENPNLQPSESEKNGIHYLKLAGPAGGPSWQQEIHAFKDGKRIWKLNVLEVEGEINGCSLNDKEISIEEGAKYLDQVPEGEGIHAWFRAIDGEQ